MTMEHTVGKLSRAEILAFALQARLTLKDGDDCYLNELATEKELIAFVRLLESWRMGDIGAMLARCTGETG